MIAFLALVLLIASGGAASAEPISLAIGLTGALEAAGIGAAAGTAGAVTAAAIGGAIVSTVASVGISLGLGLLNKALAGKPRAGEALSGVETNVQFGGDVARQIPIGVCGAKGHLVYHNSPPSLNHDYYQQVYVLSDWPCSQLGPVLWVNGMPLDIVGTPVGNGAISYHLAIDTGGLVQITFYDGTQTLADSALVGMAQPPGKWTANSRLTGMCYVYVLFTYLKGSPLYDGGIPKLTFNLRGARLYDFRRDSTVGGDGAHLWDDPSTWEFSENPAVAVYNYMRGFYRNGELLIGMGVPAADIVLDSFVAAANICDEPVQLESGSTEARYRLCTFLSADQTVTHAQTLEVLLSTMAGYLYDYGGSYYLQAGAAYSTVDTILDRDLVTNAPVTVTLKRTRAELINRIHGQWVNPLDEFQPASYVPQISQSAVDADMEELGLQLDLASVRSQQQAERIAQIRLREVRRQGTASITLGFEHLPKQVGDWIGWNSNRYGNRVWRIVNKSVEPTTLTVSLELAEIDANVFSWTIADEGDHAPVGMPIQGTAQISTVGNFQIHATTVADAAGNTFPALNFTWTPVSDPTIDAVIIEYRKVGDTVATRKNDSSPGDGAFTTTDNVVGGLDYEARATITTTPSRITTWTPWVSVKTSDLGLTSITITPDSPPSIPTGLVITSSIVTNPDGTITTLTHFVWNTVTSPSLATYELQVQEDINTNPALIDPTKFLTLAVSVTPKFDYRGITPGTHIWARVKSVSKLDNASGFSTIVGHTVAANTTAPADPAGLTALASFQTVFLSWTQNTTNTDFDHMTIYEATTNNRASATPIASTKGTSFARTSVAPGATRFYWIRAFNTSGTASVNFFPVSATAGVSATTLAITTTDISDGAVTTPKMIANTILGDRILTDSMDAVKIKANTVLAGSVTVDGTSLSTVTNRANDPAARINANTTQVDPGLVRVSGATTLANWRNGADLTKIEGGSLAANSVVANSLKIGSRGITVVGVDMQVISGTISWAAGTISFTTDAGAVTPVSISAGSAASAAIGSVIVWQKGNTGLNYQPSWAAAVTAYGADMVLMATFNGFGGLNVTYGGAIIDGARIKANTIQANNLSTGELITQSAQIGDALIITAKIGDLQVDTIKVKNGAISEVYANSGTVTVASNISIPGGIVVTLNQRYLIQAICQDAATARQAGPGFNINSRPMQLFYSDGGGDHPLYNMQAFDHIAGVQSVGPQYLALMPTTVIATQWTANQTGNVNFGFQNRTHTGSSGSGIALAVDLTVTGLKR